jgi:hypothetical protein
MSHFDFGLRPQSFIKTNAINILVRHLLPQTEIGKAPGKQLTFRPKAPLNVPSGRLRKQPTAGTYHPQPRPGAKPLKAAA